MSYHSRSWTSTDLLTGPRDGGVDGTADPRKADLLFEVLAHEHRRVALRYLVDQDEAIPLDDLQEAVVDALDWPEEQPPDARKERIATNFHHVHLGKLRDADMIVYDPELETVRPTDTAVLAAHVLDGL